MTTNPMQHDRRAIITMVAIVAGLGLTWFFVKFVEVGTRATQGIQIVVNELDAAEQQDAQAKFDLEIIEWKWGYEGSDYHYVKGRVRNKGSRTLAYYELTALGFDKNGTQVERAIANGLNLGPGMSESFNTYLAGGSLVEKVSLNPTKATIDRSR